VAERARIEVDFWKRMRHEHGGAVDVHQAQLAEGERILAALNVPSGRRYRIVLVPSKRA